MNNRWHYIHPKAFFNICTILDVKNLYDFSKDNEISFFKSSLYLSLRAANKTEQFRYRIRENTVVVHDVIHAGSTVLNVNETFSFCYFDYFKDFNKFEIHMDMALKALRESNGKLEAQDDRDDLIHYSVLPWISFTSISHPRKFRQQDSIPKIVFGKLIN